jgi:hypothetical protein
MKTLEQIEARRKYMRDWQRNKCQSDPEFRRKKAEFFKRWYWNHHEKVLQDARKYGKERRENPETRETLLAQKSASQKRNRGAANKRNRGYYQRTKDSRRENRLQATRDWRKENPDYKKNRLETDENFRLSETLRSRTRSALIGKEKSAPTLALIGVPSWDFLRNWIEDQFEPWMTWENWGVYVPGGPRTWQIDHIRPLCTFDLTDPRQQRAACNFTNLRPLDAKENLTRSDEFIEDGGPETL